METLIVHNLNFFYDDIMSLDILILLYILMDKTDHKPKRAHKPKQPPPNQPIEAPPLNLVTFTFRPLQTKK